MKLGDLTIGRNSAELLADLYTKFLSIYLFDADFLEESLVLARSTDTVLMYVKGSMG